KHRASSPAQEYFHRKVIPARRTCAILGVFPPDQGAFMRRHARGVGIAAPAGGFREPVVGATRKGTAGHYDPAVRTDYRRGPKDRSPREGGGPGSEDQTDDDLPGATVNRRGGRSVSAPEKRTTRTAQAGRPPPPGL